MKLRTILCALLFGFALAGQTAINGTAGVASITPGTPTAVGGTGAGAGPPSITVAGTDQRGTISFTAGSGAATSATVATITFASTHSNAPICILAGNNTNYSIWNARVYVASTSTGGFVLTSASSALTAVAFSATYICAF